MTMTKSHYWGTIILLSLALNIACKDNSYSQDTYHETSVLLSRVISRRLISHALHGNTTDSSKQQLILIDSRPKKESQLMATCLAGMSVLPYDGKIVKEEWAVWSQTEYFFDLALATPDSPVRVCGLLTQVSAAEARLNSAFIVPSEGAFLWVEASGNIYCPQGLLWHEGLEARGRDPFFTLVPDYLWMVDEYLQKIRRAGGTSVVVVAHPDAPIESLKCIGEVCARDNIRFQKMVIGLWVSSEWHEIYTSWPGMSYKGRDLILDAIDAKGDLVSSYYEGLGRLLRVSWNGKQIASIEELIDIISESDIDVCFSPRRVRMAEATEVLRKLSASNRSVFLDWPIDKLVYLRGR